MMDVCYSGGAEGSDTLFGELAYKAGHQVIHYSFSGHKIKVPRNQIRILSQKELDFADVFLKQANTWLKRGLGHTEYVRNLLRRNYYQIKDTNSVYAITDIDWNTDLPFGGTAWAIAMAIQRFVPTYIFTTDKGWIAYDQYSSGRCFKEIDAPLKPQGKYTGIGTRKLNDVQIQAIKDLYE